MGSIAKGTWVEIEDTILTPDQRAVNLPEETRGVPYILRVSGFLNDSAELGETVTITTRIGRLLSGKLILVNPGYNHSFGKTISEILKIGTGMEA